MDYILITGANGEVGHGLIQKLKRQKIKRYKIIAFDINKIDSKLIKIVDVFIKGDITNQKVINNIFNKYKIDTIFHLAALLSTSAEKYPELAHNINVNGTFLLLSKANDIAVNEKRVIKFIFPSSIAVYGLPDLKTKSKYKKVKEDDFLHPITIYGINKLYCEKLGEYYDLYYKLLSNSYKGIDFRCVRFPGLISAETVPSGGTSDYAPEMLHAAAQGKMYNCFVRKDSTIHFMVMPDAIDALLLLTSINRKKLSQCVYNIRGFSASAKDIELMIKKHFPKTKINYKINPKRQKIIDSWSEDVDGFKAEKDWGFLAKYNFNKAFEKYLIPNIIKKYK